MSHCLDEVAIEEVLKLEWREEPGTSRAFVDLELDSFVL